MKILNLYAGIGGNRKLWGGSHEITAVEYDPKIAAIYQKLFKNDTVIVGDAHQYLLDHYDEYDFIWTSPPCTTHSQLGRLRAFNKHNAATGQYSPAKYPDMKLYEEILLLKHFFKGKYVVENVVPYYTPLIEAQKIDRHLYWSNFEIKPYEFGVDKIARGSVDYWAERYGYKLSDLVGVEKRKVLRNCVNPQAGLLILNSATGDK
jgi:DNA (cytosine-5)-methyltransferase 1